MRAPRTNAAGTGGGGKPRPRRRHRRRKVVAGGLVVLVVLSCALVGVVGWRASGIVDLLLRRWAVGAVARRSQNAYRLEMGRVHLNWLLRRVSVDSVRLTTNVGVNAARAEPLAELRLALDRCTLSGVHLVALVRRRGFVAGSFGCREGSIAVTGPKHPPAAGDTSFLVVEQVPAPPASVQRVRIGRVDFPDLDLRVRLPRAGADEIRFTLERAKLHLSDFAIDPGDRAAASRPLFSRIVELSADSFVVRPDSFTAARVAHLQASLSDSTLDIEGIGYAPSVSVAEFERRGPGRPDVIRVSGSRAEAQGVDFGALARGSRVRAHRVSVDSLHVQVTSDYRGVPHPTRHRSPQQWMRDLKQSLDVDSLVVHHGEVEYREIRPDQPAPGVLTFSRIEMTAAPVHHVPGRKESGDSMILVASATLLHAGRLAVRFGVPLDAPALAMAFSGTLGPMPATAFNQVIEHLENWRITRGQVVGVSFGAAVRHGVALGAVTPRYGDLSVEVTGNGSRGLLSSRGMFGGAARGLASVVARSRILGANPSDASKPTRRGAIRHAFTPSQTLPAFLWQSLREGLLGALKA
jgi:hypothetical protein